MSAMFHPWTLGGKVLLLSLFHNENWEQEKLIWSKVKFDPDQLVSGRTPPVGFWLQYLRSSLPYMESIQEGRLSNLWLNKGHRRIHHHFTEATKMKNYGKVLTRWCLSNFWITFTSSSLLLPSSLLFPSCSLSFPSLSLSPSLPSKT